jgi:gluconokinase
MSIRSAAAAGILSVVVMGVTGCGKTEVGRALAARLGARFIEGDSLHPPENIAKMSAGVPLTDDDRAGWLEKIAAEIAASTAAGERTVAGCSALKRRYRDRLRAKNPRLVFVHLVIDRETAHRRVAARRGHFMPSSLVDSQFAALEPPGPDEAALPLDGTRPVDELVSETAAVLAEA